MWGVKRVPCNSEYVFAFLTLVGREMSAGRFEFGEALVSEGEGAVAEGLGAGILPWLGAVPLRV